ncbi:MAG: hypothetical protein OEZ34_09710 [Spirochaetia bacterium]|nr:hypothetical protein [Spirochaetia bacterium]
MYHKDYFIRLIQQFIVFLAELAGLRQKNDPDVILMKLEGAYLQFTGMSMTALHSLTPEGIQTVFSSTGEVDYNRLLIVAVLFKEEADTLWSIKDIHSARILYMKAEKLFEYLEGADSKICSEFIEKYSILSEIKEKLIQTELI